jgi:hypothetical protein
LSLEDENKKKSRNRRERSRYARLISQYKSALGRRAAESDKWQVLVK